MLSRTRHLQHSALGMSSTRRSRQCSACDRASKADGVVELRWKRRLGDLKKNAQKDSSATSLHNYARESLSLAFERADVAYAWKAMTPECG